MINNLIKGFQINVGFWYNGFESESALVNVLIAHNTLVDAHANTEDGARASIWIQATSGGVHGAVIKNNVILQDDESNGLLWIGDYNGNLNLDYNCWSVTPENESMTGEHTLITDPMLQKDGKVSAGELAAEWFKLNKNSTAVNAGILLDQVSEDYFGKSRDSHPDIGAHEYH
ncbi:MAG: hypothetical protein GF372_11220 [Candidatus Marinimicrobia bacterium]|nr:hypothetical protein [Candidatus Neomarinimicrobiota bacterium]